MFDRKKYMEEWREKYPEKLSEYRKRWKINNPEKVKENKRRYYADNPEKNKRYNIKHKKEKRQYDEVYRKNNRESIRKKDRRLYNTNLNFNINNKMSSAIRKSLRRNKAGYHWESLIGYSVNELIKHLKKTIPKGYTWQDFLEGKLHIDHKIPKSVFHFAKPEHLDFKKCWSLENLRLLPAKENLIKGSKLSKPFQPALKLSLVY